MCHYMFGAGNGHLPKKAEAIAKKHGGRLVNHTEPNGRKCHWFATRNLGQPHDGQVAIAVIADLEKAGLIAIDVLVEADGPMTPVYWFHLLTDKAREWIRNNVHVESWQRLHDGIVVEHRYARVLAEGMRVAGLEVR
jgi:hypothetical protein